MSHTPAPWKQTDRFINEDDGEIIVYGADEDCVLSMMCTHIGSKALEKKRANARRIVACVNACENISTEDIEGGVIGRREKFFFDYGDIMAELQTLKDVNELLKFENERMQSELSKNIVSDSDQPAPDPKLKYATWDSLDTEFKYQAFDLYGHLFGYTGKPVAMERYWALYLNVDGKFTLIRKGRTNEILSKWQQTLIERPTEQDGPTEPDPSDLAHDQNEMTYGADDPSEYDPS